MTVGSDHRRAATQHAADPLIVGQRGDLNPGAVPSAGAAARLDALALALLGDIRRWLATHPRFRPFPIEAMALLYPAASPWRTASQLAPCVQMNIWVWAVDEYLENCSELELLDDMLLRCSNVVRSGTPDHSHWLLTALSHWRREVGEMSMYPALANLWIEKFEATLGGMRDEWLAACLPHRDPSMIDDYIARADSVGACPTHIVRWISCGDDSLLSHLDLLVPTLGDYQVAARLSNDLVTISRERADGSGGNDNILLYGVTPAWVRAEIERRVASANQRLAALVAEGNLPAIELIREIEYVTTFYRIDDFRCGSE